MEKQEKEIRKQLRESKKVYCLDSKSHIIVLFIALNMPIGTVKAKIIKPENNQ